MIVNFNSLINLAPIKNMEITKIKHNGVSHGLSEAGYDIRIKQDIFFSPDGDGGRGTIVTDRNYNTVQRGRFTLASAIEEFDMPSNLVGIVHDKSTWARKGVSVFNTVIEPGWKGFLTLELVYHGHKSLLIPAGSGIAQVIFHCTTDWANYAGKYQNQEDNPVEARESL